MNQAQTQIEIERAATLTGISPIQVAFVHLVGHFDALAGYARNRTADGNVQNRLNDLIHICQIMKALVENARGPSPLEKAHADLQKKAMRLDTYGPIPGLDTLPGKSLT